jgi:putative phosphoesterase
MRIAVIADTHDRFPEAIGKAIADADQIWHLGDVCSPMVLDRIAALGPATKVVRGNCDSCVGWPMALDFRVEGFRVLLSHIAPRLAPKGVDLLLHGHTHVPRDELVGATRFLNPGCITRPNRGAPSSYAWLELKEGEPLTWRLELV